jgi:hypothetical protein
MTQETMFGCESLCDAVSHDAAACESAATSTASDLHDSTA